MKFILFFLAASLYTFNSFAGAPAKRAVYDVELTRNGVVYGLGSEIVRVNQFDPESQLYTADVEYSVKFDNGDLKKGSYQIHIGKEQEADNNALVAFCEVHAGAVRENLETSAGKFETCKGPWGFQKPDGSLTSYLWIGKNAKGFFVKEVMTIKEKVGVVLQRTRTLKELHL